VQRERLATEPQRYQASNQHRETARIQRIEVGMGTQERLAFSGSEPSWPPRHDEPMWTGIEREETPEESSLHGLGSLFGPAVPGGQTRQCLAPTVHLRLFADHLVEGEIDGSSAPEGCTAVCPTETLQLTQGRGQAHAVR